METKKILEFEKKAIKLANISKDPVSNYLTDTAETVLDKIAGATTPPKSESEFPENNGNNDSSPKPKSAFSNWLNALFAKKIGGILAFGPQGSGKTTLFQSADRVFRLCDENYCCENQVTPKTVSLENKRKWTTGCFFIDRKDGKINFNSICDNGGIKIQQKELLTRLSDANVVVFCFSLVDLYKNAPITLVESCEVSLADWLCAWTKAILLKIKENKKLQKKKMTFIYLATHADKDSLPPEYSKDFYNKISYQKIAEYIHNFNDSGVRFPINYDFIAGSFFSAQKVRNTWNAIIRSVEKQ